MSGAWLLRRLVRDFSRHGVALLAVAGAFAVVGFAGATARLAARGTTVAQPVAAAPAHIIVYLHDDADRGGTGEIERALGKLPGVAEVRFVSAREALARMRRELGERAVVLDEVGDDLLSPSLEVALRPEVAAAPLAFRLRRLRGVVDVQMVEARPAAVSVVTPAHERRAPLMIAAAAALVALLGAGGALRARGRAEIAVLCTFGFTRLGAMRPLVLLTALVALAAASAGMLAAALVARGAPGGRLLSAGEWGIALPALATTAALLALVALRVPDCVDVT